MHKRLLLAALGGIAVLGLVFYGGIKYGARPSRSSAGGNFAMLQGGRQGQFFSTGGQTGGTRRGGMGGVVAGEVIAKDDKSITVKLPDGGSKIVFFSESTKVAKSVEGTLDDVAVGKQVIVGGPANADGSVTAETLQIRPAGAMMATSSGR